MTKELLIDAVGYLDESYLADFHQMDVALVNQKNVRKRKSFRAILISAAAIMLVIAMLTVSLPVAYIANYQKVNAYVSEAVDRVLFPLDGEDGESINKEDLLINWTEWVITKQLFDALGAGTDDSLIDKMQGNEDGLVGETFNDLGKFLQKLYEYYLKYIGESDSTEEQESTEDVETDPLEQIPTLKTEGYITFERKKTQDYWTVTRIASDSRIEETQGVVVIPETFLDLPVTVIGQKAANENAYIKHIVLSDSITTIEGMAFAYCANLTQITWSKNLTEIGNGAFASTGFERITIPDCVQSFGHSVFSQCLSLQSIKLPEGLTEISDSFAWGCTSLSEIYIPDTCITVNAGAFAECTSLKRIDLPSGLQTIGDEAFASSGLETVTIPDSVTAMGTGVFQSCRSLYKAVLPDNLTYVPDNTFNQCFKLDNFVIPSSCEKIQSNAFTSCISLQEIQISDTVTEISTSAFSACTKLQKVVMSQNIKVLYNYAFSGCSALESIVLPEGLEEIGRYAFANCSALREINLPQSLKKIGLESFSGCTSLASVRIPDGIEEMGERAFLNCYNLKSAYVPAFKQEYEGPYELFMGCTRLTEVTFGEGFNENDLETGMFTETGLIEIRIPNTVHVINSRVFQNCPDLKTVYLPTELEHIITGAFKNCPNLTTMYYNGTVAQFQEEVIVGGGSVDPGVTVVCTDGEIVIGE